MRSLFPLRNLFLVLMVVALFQGINATEEGVEKAPEPVVEQESSSEPVTEAQESHTGMRDGKTIGAFVIPLQGPIGSPALFIVRRAVKDAIEQGVEAIVLNMDTPGGELGVTLEIMKVLNRFEGRSLTFVNTEAISAGAFIATITDSIYFAPEGQIGAAEVVSGSGQEIPEGMKRKLQSYINAKVRGYTEEYRYRGDVMRAMTDPDFELEIEGNVLAIKGELLSLTASEAVRAYGDPPERLLGQGIVSTVEELLISEFGPGGFEIRDFEITWSERLAQFMQKLAPVLMGIGMLLLFIEFKTPSFGLLGGAGIALILVVFASNYVAGLAGYEIILLFVLGVVLVAVEFFFLPGTLIFAFLGFALMVVSLIWSMSDLWPTSDGGVEVDWSTVITASQQVVYSLLGAFAAFTFLWRFLPKGIVSNRLVIAEQSASPSAVTVGGAVRASSLDTLPEIGAEGRVLSRMNPLGLVEIGGRQYQASAITGFIERDVLVRVVGHGAFSLMVEPIDTFA